MWHEANFTPGNYLPLSGGTITGPFRVDGEFSINRAPGVVGGMYFHRANGSPFIVFSGDAGSTGTPVDLAQIRAEQGNNAFRLTTAGLQDLVNFNLTTRLGTVAGDPTAALGIATKQYADTKLPLAGGTLTGFLTLHADPSNAMHPATKQYVDGLIAGVPSVYVGSDKDETVFPVGHVVGAVGGADPNRNGSGDVRIAVGDTDYTIGGGGAQLAGTWRARGRTSTSNKLMQRVA